MPLFTNVHNCARAMRVMADYRAARDDLLERIGKMAEYQDIGVELSGHVGTIEIRQPAAQFLRHLR